MEARKPDRAARLEHAYRRLGTREPRCKVPGCTESDTFALTGTYPEILCLEHEAASRGVSAVQQQHPQGQHNGPDTLPVPGNDHAIWDDAKKDWPEKTLCNPDGSPLRMASAGIRSVLDWFRMIIERTLGWIPPFMERLDDRLAVTIGRCWWNTLGWEGLTG